MIGGGGEGGGATLTETLVEIEISETTFRVGNKRGSCEELGDF